MILAILAFLLAINPASAGLAWLFAVPAIVLGIVGLTRKGKNKTTSWIGGSLGALAWLISIIVFVVTLATAGSAGGNSASEPLDTTQSSSQPSDTTEDEVDDVADEPVAEPEEPVAEPEEPDAPEVQPGAAKIGDTVKNDDDVEFSVTKVKCGLKEIGEQYLEERASGQFCEIKFSLKNGSDDAVSISSSDVAGLIGDSTYSTDATSNRFGDDYFLTEVNPGLKVKCVVYIDIPKGKKLDYFQYDPAFSLFTDAILIQI